MIMLDDFLYNLYIQKKITYQMMMMAAAQPADLETKVKDFSYSTGARR
jgi:Tfp pilus assembly ATPase PilU